MLLLTDGRNEDPRNDDVDSVLVGSVLRVLRLTGEIRSGQRTPPGSEADVVMLDLVNDKPRSLLLRGRR